MSLTELIFSKISNKKISVYLYTNKLEMQNAMEKLTASFAADLQVTLVEFAHHLAKEWEVDASKVEEAIASYAPAEKQIRKPASKTTKGKRTKSAYMFFCDTRRPELKEEGYNFGEISKAVGAEWKELSEEDRKEYVEMAVKAKEENGEEKQENKNSSPVKAKKTEEEKEKEKMYTQIELAKKKTKEDEKNRTHCYNFSTHRICIHKDGDDKAYELDLYVCAKTQKELEENVFKFFTPANSDTESE